MQTELEQLERLRYENTPRRPMITHTIDSYQIPSQNKTKWKLRIWKFAQNSNFIILQKIITRHTFWSCLVRCVNLLEMDLASIVEVTERTRFCPQTTDIWSDWETDSLCWTWSRGYNNCFAHLSPRCGCHNRLHLSHSPHIVHCQILTPKWSDKILYRAGKYGCSNYQHLASDCEGKSHTVFRQLYSNTRMPDLMTRSQCCLRDGNSTVQPPI